MSLMYPYPSITEDLNRFFNDFLAPTVNRTGQERGTSGNLVTNWMPAVDIIEEENDIKVKAQVPGINPENIDIEVDNNTVTLSGRTTEQREEGTQGSNFYRREIMSGSFYRKINLPTEVQGNNAEANFEHGMLTITLPKSEETRRHKIRVNTGTSGQTQKQSQK